MEIIKKIFSFIGRCMGVIWGAVFALGGLGGLIAAITEKQPAFYAMVVPMWALAALLLWVSLKKKKAAKNSSNHFVLSTASPNNLVRTEMDLLADVPEETLTDMRRYYTPMQAAEDARILQDSFQLCQRTTNIDTFLSRLDVVQRSALTLLQAQKAKCRGIQKGTAEACLKVLNTTSALKLDFLHRAFEKETEAAMQLKTPAGQRRRLEAFLTALQAKEDDFLDVEDAYNQIIDETKALMQ